MFALRITLGAVILLAVAVPAFGAGALHVEVLGDDNSSRSLHLGGDLGLSETDWLGLDAGLGQYDDSSGESIDTRSFSAYFSHRGDAVSITPTVDYWHDDAGFTSTGLGLDLGWQTDALRWTLTPRWRRVSLDSLQADGSVTRDMLNAPGLGVALDAALTDSTHFNLAVSAYHYDLSTTGPASTLNDELASVAALGGWRRLLMHGDQTALYDFLVNNGLTELAALLNSGGLADFRQALRSERVAAFSGSAPEVLEQGLIDRRVRVGVRHDFADGMRLGLHYTVNRYAQDGSKAHDLGLDLTLPAGRAWDLDLGVGRWSADWGDTTYGSIMLTRYF